MLTLVILVALLIAAAAAWSFISHRRPVTQQGLLGAWLERHAARGGAGPLRLRRGIHATIVGKAVAGIRRHALAKIHKALVRHHKHTLEAENRGGAAKVAASRAEDSAKTEATVLSALRAVAPQTLGHHSVLVPRLAALALFLGGCLLNANTYADFEPSQQDAVTSGLRAIGISPAWALGAFQMLGMTLLGSAIAHCVVYALAPTVGLFAGEETKKARLVYGHFSPGVLAVLAAVGFAFAMLVAYAVARLRLYGTILDAAGTAGNPAAGSLGGSAAAPTPTHPMFTFMVLALLELVATIAVFVVFEPAVARTAHALEKRTKKDRRRAEQRTRRADRSRTAAMKHALAANRWVHEAALRGWQVALDGEALTLEAATKHDPSYEPDAAVFDAPDGVLPAPGTVKLPDVTSREPVSEATQVLNDTGIPAQDYTFRAKPASNGAGH
jgi:hypothetical protein